MTMYNKNTSINRRKCKCGGCGKDILKGEGYEQFGNITHKRYFLCVDCWNYRHPKHIKQSFESE